MQLAQGNRRGFLVGAWVALFGLTLGWPRSVSALVMRHGGAAPRGIRWRPRRLRGHTLEQTSEGLIVTKVDGHRLRLNESAGDLLRSCDGKRTVWELEQAQRERYNAEAARLRSQLRQTLQILVQLGLIA